MLNNFFRLLIVLCCAGGTAHAQLTKETVQQHIRELLQTVTDNYVYPATAKKAKQHVLTLQEKGAYDTIQQGERLAAALAQAATPRDKVATLIRVHLNSLLGENQAALEVMLYEWRSVSEAQRPGLIVLRDRYEALWQAVLDEAAAAGLVKPETRLLRRMLLGSLHWSVQWFRQEGRYSVDELAEHMIAMILI